MTRAPRLPPALVALSDGDLDATGVRAFVERVRAARTAGLAAILLREARLCDRDFLALARALRELLGGGGWLALHDRAHLAAEAGADAVHAGFHSLAPAELSPWLAESVAIGLSTHAHDEPAAWAGADYLVHGPVFDTPSKRGLVEPIGVAGLAAAVRRAVAPVYAIGGLRPEHADDVRAAGASGLFVRAALLGDDDPARATRAFLQALA